MHEVAVAGLDGHVTEPEDAAVCSCEVKLSPQAADIVDVAVPDGAGIGLAVGVGVVCIAAADATDLVDADRPGTLLETSRKGCKPLQGGGAYMWCTTVTPCGLWLTGRCAASGFPLQACHVTTAPAAEFSEREAKLPAPWWSPSLSADLHHAANGSGQTKVGEAAVPAMCGRSPTAARSRGSGGPATRP
eukprot:scaffold8082_cov430-Prasinococcus_capsulatus_cf.AAC.1